MAAGGAFARYLEAKRTVDDRALNRQVWQALANALAPTAPERPLEVLEVGAGTGAMFRRTLEWGLLQHARYTAVDSSRKNIASGLDSLGVWGRENGYSVQRSGDELWFLRGEALRVQLRMVAADFYDFQDIAPQSAAAGGGGWSLLIAHAFMDLVDLARALPRLLAALCTGGLFYFPITFDGLTTLEPPVDPVLDELILALYHRSMDERLVSGAPSGDSRTGRRLFAALRKHGGQVLAAGSSDWVVFPGPDGYPHQEGQFLHFIIETIANALHGHPQLLQYDLDRWVTARQAQITRRELVYIAHQLDIFGRKTGSGHTA